MRSSKYLSIYLNDHLAAVTVVRDVAHRCLRSNRNGDLATFLERVVGELDDSVAELERLAGELGVRRDPIKKLAAWAAEKAGRLKLNGHLFSYSPLSRVLEIEGLVAGTEIESGTWRALEHVSGRDFSHRVEACRRRREDLAWHHAAAVAVALDRRPLSPTRW